MAAILVLDAGTGGAKAALFATDGRLLSCHVEPWEYQIVPNAQVPMVKEYAFDPAAFWDILCASARAALRSSAESDILGIVCTSQREGCVFLDAAGAEIYAGPNLDSRGFLEGLEVLEKLGPERLYAITGHSAPFIFPLVRYLWFRKHDRRDVAHVLMINDWMSYRLCGEIASEPSNAGESMLFDFRRRAWSEEILETFEIPSSLLPPLRVPGERLGVVGSDVAAALGVAAGTSVFVGGADTQCALLGAGAHHPGDVGIVLGTTTPLQLVVDRPVLDAAANLWAGSHVVAERWVIEANVGSTGDAYRWLLDLCLHGVDDPHRRAAELVAAARCDGTLMFIGPRLFDLTKVRPDMPGGVLFRFPSLQMRPGPGELLRAFWDSVAFAAQGNLEQIETLLPGAATRLCVGGGLSRSDVLVETLADLLPLPLHRATVAESSALGCAILVAVGAGVYADVAQAVTTMCHDVPVAPRAASRARLEADYRRWRATYDQIERISI
jgi:autoinducer 2 (AI-2) kinase